MPMYIHQLSRWPQFHYDPERLFEPLSRTTEQRGYLFGNLEALGFDDLREAKIDAIASEATESSAIEGESLDYAAVRSSVAKRLGIETGGLSTESHRIEGVVEMSVDAAENWAEPLTVERLFDWHAGLFPGGRNAFGRLKVAQWRDDLQGPMQVVSRAGSEKPVVHFEAPSADRLPAEMAAFLNWFESPTTKHSILTAGIAHLWFVTIHPFEDGNGRIGRAILDLSLAKADQRPWRCYSASTQIHAEKPSYYRALETAQKGTLDITEWLDWYLGCLGRALEAASNKVSGSLARGRFWKLHADRPFNERQRKVLNLVLGGEMKEALTNKRWKRITACSDATATRDLDDLVQWQILSRHGAARAVRYTVNDLARPGGDSY